MSKIYPVYTLKNECHDCYKCVRECYVKAIKIQNGRASVINERCIACGHCVIACPSNAKRVRTDIQKVRALFAEGKKVFVSLAPSWAGIYNVAPQKIIALLKALGFYAVSETAVGAQEVSIETAKLLNSAEAGLFISSACPVIVDFIRLYKPDFVKNITPVASPALTHAKLLKQIYGDDIAVVFIGPCIGKKNEADRHPELIDAALTFDELNLWLKEEFISVETIDAGQNNAFVPERSYEGAIYPVEGGMNETIKRIGVDGRTSLINISGLRNFGKAIDGIQTANMDKKIFIEALSCESGCVNGPCKSTGKSGVMIISDIMSRVRFRDDIPEKPRTVLAEEYSANPSAGRQYSPEEITKAMERIGKYKEEDELNCGGCGYSACRDLAKALIDGDAEPSMCVSYMRKIAMKKSAAMLRCMPNAVVMVDKDLNIIESNDAFLKMFCGDMYDFFSKRSGGIKGASIEKTVSFGDIFKRMLKTGEDVHKEHYPCGNKLYDINAFTIEKGNIVGAVITDVTKTEIDREKIAQKAREVISKNIAKVQEIACILGEHMSETEVLLNSIAEDYAEEKNDNEEEGGK